MRRLAAVLCVVALVCALTGCSLGDFSNSTVTGQVTAINGTEVTLLLGELNEVEDEDVGGGAMAGGQQMPEAGDTSSQGQDGMDQGSGQTEQTPQGGMTYDQGQGMDASQMEQGTPSADQQQGTSTEESESEDSSQSDQTPNILSLMPFNVSTSYDGFDQAGTYTVADAYGDEATGTDDAQGGDATQTAPGGVSGEDDMSGNAQGTPDASAEGGAQMPEGDMGGSDMSGGDQGGMPGGDMGGQDGTAEGDMGGQGGMPGGDMGGSSVTFAANGETTTIDLGDATVTVEGAQGDTEETVYDIQVDDVLVIEVGDNNSITSVTVKDVRDANEAVSDMLGGMLGGDTNGGSSEGSNSQGTAANTLDTDGTYSDMTYTSVNSDENALRVSGANVILDNPSVNKDAGESSNPGEGDFYGMNAALLATAGAQVMINGGSVYSAVQGGNGVFSYGSGTTVNITDTTITTTSDNSGGIQTTGGATTNATNLDVNTSGSSAAAIRSDRGGGTVTVDRGSYVSNGFNSPAIYSTADITVRNAYLCAHNSEAFVIEGKNSIALENCNCTGNMSSTQGTSSDENVHTVMIYQSMSGDADQGTSNFSMTGGSLTANNGDVFYITNTQCTVSLEGTEIIDQGANGDLIRVCGNSGTRGWGNAGSNGGTATIRATDQTLEGSIEVDTISKLDLTLSGSSTLNGVVTVVNNAAGGASVGDNATITIENGSTWNLTGDCTVTSVDNRGIINYNGHTITLADGTVMSG
ncbi:MAG: hypothetical protein LUD25_05350 [Coriobacteriaceae bacterium]|nr:hypothetical protein [Coriobacteriaceae bacterium]